MRLRAKSNKLLLSTAVLLTCGGLAFGSLVSQRSQAAESSDLRQTTPGNVFVLGETPTFEVTSEAEEISWAVRDYWGGQAVSGTEPVPGNGEVQLEVPMETSGYYELNVTSGGTQHDTAFAVVPEPARDAPEDYVFGVQTTFNRDLNPDLPPLLTKAGVESVRDAQPWAQIEHTKGEYDFGVDDGIYQKYMAALADEGISPLLNFGLTNEHYDEGATPHTDAGRQGYANFVTEVLTEYESQVTEAVVYNEPNIRQFGDVGDGPANATPQSYFELLRTTYEKVKAARPDVTVASPELGAGSHNVDDWEVWLDRLFELGALDYMDAVSVHPYRDRCGCGPDGVDDDVKIIQDLLEKYDRGDMPIWITEQGWSNTLDTEEDQASFVVRAQTEAMAAGVERYSWFSFLDGNGKEFGLLRAKDDPLGPYAPKPSYVAYSVLTNELSGASYAGAEDTPDGVSGRRFDGPDGPTRVLWAPKGQPNVTLATDEPLTVTDLMGQERELTPVNGKVTLSLSSDPVYVDGQVSAITKGAAYDIETEDAALSESVPATLTLNNSDGEHDAATFTVAGEPYELTAPDGEKVTEKIEVPSGGHLGQRTIFAEVDAADTRAGFVADRSEIFEDVEVRVEPRLTDVDARQGALAVELSNHTTTEQQVNAIEWEASGQSGTWDDGLALPAQSTETVEIPLPDAVGFWALSSHNVQVSIDELGIRDSTGSMAFDPVAGVTVSPDGDLSELADSPGVNLVEHGKVQRTQLGIPYEGPSDLSGTMWVASDSDNLYIAAKVTDDVRERNGSGTFSPRGDGIQFALSPGMPGESGNFYEYVVSSRPNVEAPEVLRSFAPGGGGIGVTDDPAAIVRDEEAKTTYYEVAIPWSDLGIIEPDDKAFSLSMLVNDNDGKGREGWIEWGSGVGTQKDPSLYNPVVR